MAGYAGVGKASVRRGRGRGRGRSLRRGHLVATVVLAAAVGGGPGNGRARNQQDGGSGGESKLGLGVHDVSSDGAEKLHPDRPRAKCDTRSQAGVTCRNHAGLPVPMSATVAKAVTPGRVRRPGLQMAHS